MNYEIKKYDGDLGPIVHIWEESVRATHDFVTEEDILFYRSVLLSNGLDDIELFAVYHEVHPIGFMGVADDKIEMLFVLPGYAGRGIGSCFIEYAITELGSVKVDVNEQNSSALEFYQKKGFKIVSRDQLDPSGKPYPILHLELDKTL